MKATEIREKTGDELITEVRKLKAELFSLRLQQATGNLDNPLKLREVRRDIARAKTVIKERELKGE